MQNDIILIMAGGLGKRMNSNIPKVLIDFNNKPMLVHLIENALKINPYSILIVVGKYKDLIKATLEKFFEKEQLQKIEYIFQEEAKGTGHAVMCAYQHLNEHLNKNLLILSGDTPLIDNSLMNNMLEKLENFKVCTTYLLNPFGYGRIIHYKDWLKDSNYTKIVEEKDCTEEEKLIQKVNCGLYSIKINLLIKYLFQIDNNNIQNEYYLTKLIEIITKNENFQLEYLIIPEKNQYKVLGVNTQQQLLELENLVK